MIGQNSRSIPSWLGRPRRAARQPSDGARRERRARPPALRIIMARRRSSWGVHARFPALNLAPVRPRRATTPGRSSPRTTSRRPKDGRRLRRHGDASRHRRASRRCVIVRVGDYTVARRRRDRVLNARPPPDPRRPSRRVSDRPTSHSLVPTLQATSRPPAAARASPPAPPPSTPPPTAPSPARSSPSRTRRA